MGYACPVCETPQSDAEHLANHLAFTAMLGDDDHEAWLDDHAPNWDEAGEAELAARVEEYGKEVGFPQVFDDTSPDHRHDHGDEPRPGELFEDELERANEQGRGSMAGGTGSDASGGAGAGGGRAGTGRGRGAGAGTGASESLDAEAQQILREAQEMTEEMLDDEADDADADATEGETE